MINWINLNQMECILNMPLKQAGTEDSYRDDLAEHHQGRNLTSGDVCCFQASDSYRLQHIYKF